jgi:hypothetical protein
MKKLLLVTFVLLLAFQTICFAAISGSKSSPRPASPPPSSSTTQTAPAPASGYKPSAPASSYTDKAPAAQPSAAANVPQTSGGGFMRNLGMLGGGMLLGGMLSSVFGQGNTGILSSLLGAIISVVPFVAIFLAGRFLWNRMRRNQGK